MSQDMWYDRRPWEDSSPVIDQSVGPDQSNQERIVSQRLEQCLAPPAPPPQRVLFAPRFGYPTHEPTITDVVKVEQEWPQPVDSFGRDTYGEYSGTSTPSFSNDLGKP